MSIMTNPTDNSEITNTTDASVLPRFSELGALDQRAVVLRAEGYKYEQISAALKAEFGVVKAPETIRTWFSPSNDGRLVQASWEYREKIAKQNLAEGRNLAKRYFPKAVANIIEKMNSFDEGISLKASGMLADKFLPNAHRLELAVEDELPDELDDEIIAEVEGELAAERDDDLPEELNG